MLSPDLHRVLLVILLFGNAIAFAGLDPLARALSAVVVLVLMVDLPKMPEIPRLHRLALLGCAVLMVIHLLPWPYLLRKVLQPGFADLMPRGWAPLSLAPWATIETGAALVVVLGIALVAARMAGTRTGLPVVLALIAATGGIIAVLGLTTEVGTPAKVLLIRINTSGGSAVYGPYLNHNHFAQGLELTLPAVAVLLAVAFRHLLLPGTARRQASVTVLACLVVLAVGCAAMLRCVSRGGVLVITASWLLTLLWWWKPRRAWRWLWLLVAVLVVTGAIVLGWTQLSALQDGIKELLVIEGVDGNTRWDLWAGTARLWLHNPILGSGLGSYAWVIGVDKPATHGLILETAHNDWLEWLATTGIVGAALLLLMVIGLARLMRLHLVRRLRFEFRYPLAGAMWALTATAMHETIGFGLRTPLNRYLLAVWIGLVWGLKSRMTGHAGSRSEQRGPQGSNSEVPEATVPSQLPDTIGVENVS